MKKNIKCLCGSNLSIEYKEEIDLDAEPSIVDSILNGTFMSYDCNFCKKKHKPEFKIILIWKSKNIKIEVFPELDRSEFYSAKKEKSSKETVSFETVSSETVSLETVIGFPEMTDRIAVIKDSLEPVVIETLKSYILARAEENYPDNEINVWYHNKGPAGIEFHLDGIRTGEVAVMRVPQEAYDKTMNDYKKNPKSGIFPSLRVRSYLSIHNILRPAALK